MLSWFVGRHAAESALTGRILTKRDVKINPASVSTACLDENISMHRIKHYLTPEGWKTLLNTWEKVISLDWKCWVCKKELYGEQIGCDRCLLYHYSCVGKRRRQNVLLGFGGCRACYESV